VPFRVSVERGIKIWLNEHHNLTGNVEVSIAVDDLQRADTLAEELTDQTEPLTGTERLETAAQLARAGYSDDEITDIVGERPLDESDEATDDVDESGSDTA
jgi:SOS response regulatory protein OraA/RecX